MHTFTIPGAYSTASASYDSAVLWPMDSGWPARAGTERKCNDDRPCRYPGRESDADNSPESRFHPRRHLSAGKALYLLQKLNDSPGHYYVRVYNVGENVLEDTPIVDKTALYPSGDPNMSGVALARQVSNGGTFAYTLYIDTRRNYAFIHELPLNDQVYPPIAHCIDLPVGKSADLLHFYTLALSPDGGTLSTRQTARLVWSAASMSQMVIPWAFSMIKSRTPPTLTMGMQNVSNIERGRMLYNGAVLSSDQKTLYFAGIQGLWAVNTSNLNIQGHYLAQQTLTGVALSSDNQTLYAVDPAKGITLLSATTGQIQKVMQGAAHSPWGIAWIVN